METSVFRLVEWGGVVHPLRVVLAKRGLIPGELKVMGSRPVTSSQIIGERVYQRDTDKQKVSVSDKASSSLEQIQSPVDKAPPPAA